jgi:DNA relaxase NicK
MRLLREGDNCTRLDVQVTIEIGEENIHAFLLYQEQCAMSRPMAKGHRAVVDHYASNGKYQTVYIGSRSSDTYVRIYDKFAESAEERYRGTVRFEAEIKGKKSKALWAYLETQNQPGLRILQLLLQILEQRGLDVSDVDIARADVVLPKAEPLREDVSLRWLAGQVAPTVKRLCQSRGWIAPFSALFSSAIDEQDRRAIMAALALQWGN